MAGMLDGLSVETRVLSHQDVTGVGYGICMLQPQGTDDSRHFLDADLNKIKNELNDNYKKKDPYVNLARAAIYEYVQNGKELEVPDNLPDEMISKRGGTFVSVHKFGDLRGCIGTIAATRKNLAKEIIGNAISAVSNDNRFSPVTKNELDYLDISVDVLSEAEDIDDMSMLDVKKYGVIVTSGKQKRPPFAGPGRS